MLRISVEFVEDGEVSPYLAGELAPGDAFEIRGPDGAYFTWSADEPGPLLLVSGGAGLVPLMSMLRHRVMRDVAVQAYLLVSLGRRRALPRRAGDTRAAGGAARRAHLHARGAAGLDRLERAHQGRDAHRRLTWTGRAVLRRGPTAFVEAVNDLLVAGGHDPRDVHAERFGPTGG